MAKLNERYRVTPKFAMGEGGTGKTAVGEVVYVHPLGRYATLEFEGMCGNCRETFWPEELTPQNRVRQKAGCAQ